MLRDKEVALLEQQNNLKQVDSNDRRRVLRASVDVDHAMNLKYQKENQVQYAGK